MTVDDHCDTGHKREEPASSGLRRGCAGAIHPLYMDYRVPMALFIPRPPDRRRMPETWQRR